MRYTRRKNTVRIAARMIAATMPTTEKTPAARGLFCRNGTAAAVLLGRADVETLTDAGTTVVITTTEPPLSVDA